jgi:hypothetical protein
MKICYVKKDFSATSLATIKRANTILVEYVGNVAFLELALHFRVC